MPTLLTETRGKPLWLWWWETRQRWKRRLLRVALWPLRCECAWHQGNEPIDWDAIDRFDEPPPGCPNCGSLWATKDCRRCGRSFVDWGSTGWDSVMAGPALTSSGDAACMRCVGFYEREDDDLLDCCDGMEAACCRYNDDSDLPF